MANLNSKCKHYISFTMVLLYWQKKRTKSFEHLYVICKFKIFLVIRKKEKPKVFGLKIRFIPRFISCIHFSTLCKFWLIKSLLIIHFFTLKKTPPKNQHSLSKIVHFFNISLIWFHFQEFLKKKCTNLYVFLNTLFTKHIIYYYFDFTIF